MTRLEATQLLLEALDRSGRSSDRPESERSGRSSDRPESERSGRSSDRPESERGGRSSDRPEPAQAIPIVASLGHPAYDLFAAGDRPANFYTWGSMGLASSIGLGLALARPDLRVFVLDGDGSLLMNLGSLATIGWAKPEGLVVIVLDNEVYGTTGGQETATAHGADLAAAATALGAAHAVTVRGDAALADAIARTAAEPGPWVIVAKVEESAPSTKPPLDCVFIKQRFMAALGSPEAATRGERLRP